MVAYQNRTTGGLFVKEVWTPLFLEDNYDMCTLFHVVTQMFSYALRNEQSDPTMSLEKVKNSGKL